MLVENVVARDEFTEELVVLSRHGVMKNHLWSLRIFGIGIPSVTPNSNSIVDSYNMESPKLIPSQKESIPITTQKILGQPFHRDPFRSKLAEIDEEISKFNSVSTPFECPLNQVSPMYMTLEKPINATVELLTRVSRVYEVTNHANQTKNQEQPPHRNTNKKPRTTSS